MLGGSVYDMNCIALENSSRNILGGAAMELALSKGIRRLVTWFASGSGLLLASAVCLLLAGCASRAPISNLTPIGLVGEPVTQIYEDHNAELQAYTTFSVFPQSSVTDEPTMNPILERQLLFAVRNMFEQKRYRFVRMDESPDFCITLRAEAPYGEKYVPPSSITLPHWEPAKKIVKRSSSSGTFDSHTSGEFSSSTWGSWTGSGSETVEVPGYMTTRTYTRPGYTAGFFYPSIAVHVYDGKRMENVWTGLGVGSLHNGDVRISGQLVMATVLAHYPACPRRSSSGNSKSGKIGIHYSILTNDGNSYYPTVVKVIGASPAEYHGLRTGDMIVHVDGRSTINKPYSEIWEILDGAPGTEVRLGVRRLEDVLDFSIRRVVGWGR